MEKQDVLFLVHTEDYPSWNEKVHPRMYWDLQEHIVEDSYHRVIWLSAEAITGAKIHPQLEYLNDDTWYWEWGYEPEMFTDDPNGIEIPYNMITGDTFEEVELSNLILSSGHEYTLIPEELRKEHVVEGLKNCNVFVCGGFDGECLSDWESVLSHVGIEYERLNQFIW